MDLDDVSRCIGRISIVHSMIDIQLANTVAKFLGQTAEALIAAQTLNFATKLKVIDHINQHLRNDSGRHRLSKAVLRLEGEIGTILRDAKALNDRRTSVIHSAWMPLNEPGKPAQLARVSGSRNKPRAQLQIFPEPPTELAKDLEKFEDLVQRVILLNAKLDDYYKPRNRRSPQGQ